MLTYLLIIPVLLFLSSGLRFADEPVVDEVDDTEGDALDVEDSHDDYETEEGDEETAEPEVPTIDPSLISRVQERLGLDAEDLEGFDENRLNRMLSKADEKYLKDNPHPTQDAQIATQNAMPEFKGLELELNDELDEAYSGPIKGVSKFMNDQLRELHNFRNQITTEVQAYGILMEMSEVDRFVSGLGDSWVGDYGTGVTAHMDPKSDAFRNRLDVYRSAKRLVQDEASRGGYLSLPDAVNRIHRAKFVDKIVERETEKRVSKSQTRKKQMSDRPSRGKAPALSVREEAVKAFAGQ